MPTCGTILAPLRDGSHEGSVFLYRFVRLMSEGFIALLIDEQVAGGLPYQFIWRITKYVVCPRVGPDDVFVLDHQNGKEMTVQDGARLAN